MSEQLMIDFDPEGTAIRKAAEHARDAAYIDLVATVRVRQAAARAQGLWLTADEDGCVTVLVCPACGEYEANEFLVATNHAISRDNLRKRGDGTWVTAGREYGREWCLALDLTTRHIAGESEFTDSQIRMCDRLRADVRERFQRAISGVRHHVEERQRRHG